LASSPAAACSPPELLRLSRQGSGQRNILSNGPILRRPSIIDRFQKGRHESVPRRLCLACTSSPVCWVRTLVRPVPLSTLVHGLRDDRAVKLPDVRISLGWSSTPPS